MERRKRRSVETEKRHSLAFWLSTVRWEIWVAAFTYYSSSAIHSYQCVQYFRVSKVTNNSTAASVWDFLDFLDFFFFFKRARRCLCM